MRNLSSRKIKPLHFYSDEMRKEAPPYTWRKGSLTVEAAIVLPVMACFFCFILFYFRIMQVQVAVQNSLEKTARKLAILSVQELEYTENELAYLGIAKTLVYVDLSQQEHVEKYVRGGALGVSLLASEFDKDDILLKANYGIKFPITLLGDKIFRITQKAQLRKWLGWHSVDVDVEQERIVYVTRYGTVCHLRKSCPFLSLSIERVLPAHVSERRNEDGERYKACEVCIVNSTPDTSVYVTHYGNRYHADIGCSGIKRTIYQKSIAEVGGMETCPKCWK